MKKLNRVGLITALLAFIAVSCNEEEFAPGVEEVVEVQDDAVIEDGFDEAEDLAFVGIFATSTLGGRTESDDERVKCAEITKEKDQEKGTFTITIDFGEGCTGPNGRVRKGKIVVIHDGRIWEYGSAISIELFDFSIDDVAIEGKRTVTNKTTDLSSGVVHAITLEGGKVTWPDSSFATREVEKTRTWTRDANNPRQDVILVTGGASGTNRRGVAYEMTIIEPIQFVRNCRGGKMYVPVKGIKEIVTDQRTIEVDFGDGECDRIVTITVNGESREVKL